MRKRKAPPGRASIVQEGIVKPCGPHQRTRRSGSVHALKTSARGASKTRSMTSVRSAVVAVGLVLGAMSLSFPLQLAQVVIQAREALFPETPIVLEPVRGVLEGTRL